MQPGAPARILVVEDDFLVAADVETALLDEGFEIVGIAESADRAVELAATQKPALILMDIRLVGVRDGIDAAVEIFRDHGIRCVFASAHSDLHARTRSEPAQPLGWLQKPYTMNQLVMSVKRALSDLADLQ
jgi:DNA-binding NarL/FixJ family response regulator